MQVMQSWLKSAMQGAEAELKWHEDAYNSDPQSYISRFGHRDIMGDVFVPLERALGLVFPRWELCCAKLGIF
jgi:hypothetical protein